jgi:outer membrane lipoprotein-sorting protein
MVVGLVFLTSCLSHGGGGAAKAESPIAPPTGALQQNAPQAAALNTNSTADDVLDALQAAGKNMKSFSADLKLDEINDQFGTETLRFGKIWFQTKPNGDETLHVLMDHKEVEKKQTPEKKEYLLDRGWLIDRNYDLKIETRTQLVPAGQKVNLFQLGKGPFPLPIGQDKKDVLAEFAASVAAPDKDDPAGTIHLKLKPLPRTQWAQTFVLVEVWVDFKTNMPVRVATQSKTEYKVTDLLNLKVNPALNPNDLALPPLDKGWKPVDRPLPPATAGQN